MESMIPIIVIFVATYFFMIRPAQKKVKETQEMLNTLEKGTHVVTIGGLHGVIEEINDTTVVLDCEGVYLTFENRAISRVVPNQLQYEATPQEEQQVIDNVEEFEKLSETEDN